MTITNTQLAVIRQGCYNITTANSKNTCKESFLTLFLILLLIYETLGPLFYCEHTFPFDKHKHWNSALQ